MAARIHSPLLALLFVATSACAAPARTGDRGTVVAFVNVAVVPMDSERVLRVASVDSAAVKFDERVCQC